MGNSLKTMQEKEKVHKIFVATSTGGAKWYKKTVTTTVSMLLCFATLLLGTPRTTWAFDVTGAIANKSVESSDSLILNVGEELVLTANEVGDTVSWSAVIDFEDNTSVNINSEDDAKAYFSAWKTSNTSGSYNDVLTLSRTTSMLSAPGTVTVTGSPTGSGDGTFKFTLAGRGYLWVSDTAFGETTTTNLADENQVVVLPSDGSGTFYVATSPSKDSFGSGASDSATLSAQVVEETNDTPIEGATVTVDDSVNSIKITGATNGSRLKITSNNSDKWLCEPAYVKLSMTTPTPNSNVVKTSDLDIQLAVAGIGSVLVFALGIMISLIKNKKRISD